MEEIVLGVKVNTGDGKRSVADLRNEMKTLTEEVQNTERGTDAYAKAIQKLGATKAELKDLKEDIAALDPDAKAKAFIGLGQTMVAGFTAAQGAAALFGSENEDIQKGILKMQAAIGVLHGIQAAADAADQVGRLKIIALQQLQILETKKQIVATEGATVAQRIWNLAMAANPIGLIVTGVVALTAAVAAYTLATKKSADEQDRHNKLLEESRKKIIPEHNESLKKRLSVYTDVTKQEIALLEEKGASEDVIFEKKKQLIQQELTILDAALKYKGNLNAEEQKQKRQLYFELELLEIQHQNNLKKIKDEADAESKRKAEEEDAKYLASIQAKQSRYLEEAESERVQQETLNGLRDEYRDQDDVNRQAFYEMHDASFQEKKDKELATEQFYGEAMYNAAKATNASLLSLTDLAVKNQDKAFKIKKAIAIADLAVDTAKAISGAIAQAQSVPFPGNIAAVAVGVATVLANVLKARQILQSANPGSGGGSISGGAVSAPSPNVQRIQTGGGDTATTTRLGQEGSGKPVQEIKVSVLESEITSTQNRVRVIEARSTF